jgi:6-phosphofructokinase 1
MCAADRTVQLDVDEAYMCGKKAVELASQGKTGLMVTLVREPGSEYSWTTGTANLSEVAVKAKPMPDKFINSEGNFTTKEFLDYIRPLVGSLPQYTKLENKKPVF